MSSLAKHVLLGFSSAAVLLVCVPVAGRGQDCCDCPRMTLMQWSYGTSFEGGPPGFDEPLVADRPDFTEASTTVGRGVAQLEIGYTYLFDSQGGDSTVAHSYPEPLLRVGILAEWLELRVGWNFAEQRTFSQGISTVETGSEDLYLGVKIALTPQEGLLPEMALIPQMTVPVGDVPFTAHEVLAGLNWIYSWEVNDCISLAGSTQGNGAIDDATDRSYWEMAQSAVVGWGLTERIGAFTEWVGLFPHSADSAIPEHYFNGGFTFHVTNNLMFDVRAGVGLNPSAADYFLGVGSAIRL